MANLGGTFEATGGFGLNGALVRFSFDWIWSGKGNQLIIFFDNLLGLSNQKNLSITYLH